MAYARTGTLSAAIIAHVLFDVVPTAGLTLGPDLGQVVGFVVFIGGYALAVGWLLVPSLYRWRSERTERPLPTAYLDGAVSDARSLWTVATQSPVNAAQVDPLRHGA